MLYIVLRSPLPPLIRGVAIAGGIFRGINVYQVRKSYVDNPAAFGGSIPITNARPLIVTFEKSEATPEPASLLGLAVVAGLGAAASKRKRNAI